MSEFGAMLWEDSGPFGRAREYAFVPQIVDQQAALVAYELVAQPPQHPAWNRYILSVVHLRPIEGVRPANIIIEGATHEVMVLALDPNHPDQFEQGGPLRYLTPANVVAQLVVPIDDTARADDVVRGVVRMCARGFTKGYPTVEDGGQRLSNEWRAMLDKTMEHEIFGEHL